MGPFLPSATLFAYNNIFNRNITPSFSREVPLPTLEIFIYFERDDINDNYFFPSGLLNSSSFDGQAVLVLEEEMFLPFLLHFCF